MISIPVSRSEGYVFNDEPIYKVINHPSGYVLLDYKDDVIASFKSDETISVDKW